MSMQMTGWEAEIVLPYSEDLNQHHLGVFTHLRRAAPGWSHHSDDGRSVQFVTINRPDLGKSVALVRFAGTAPNKMPTREKALTVEYGARIKFAVLMTATKHATGSKNRYVGVPDSEMPAFVSDRMSRMGLAAADEHPSIRPMKGVFIGKGRRGFGVDVVEIHGMAVVADLELLLKAWRFGIGSQRTFGLGMLRISDVELP